MNKMANDKLLHVGACAVIAFAFSALAYFCGCGYGSRVVMGIAVALACGLAKEYADEQHTEGAWSWGDVLADFIGAVVGAGIFIGCTYDAILPTW